MSSWLLLGHLHSYPGAHGACELWAVSWAHLVESVHHQGNLLLYGKVIQQESGWTGSPSANREAALVLARYVSVARLPWVLPSAQFLLCKGTIVLFPKLTHTPMNCPVPKAYPYIHELSCSKSLPINPWINLLADFWNSHLRNEFTWCYANPSISYSYISMNDYRSWARLIEFFPSSRNKAATLGFFTSLCFLVSRESAVSWSDMLPSDCRYLLSHVFILLYFIVTVLMRTWLPAALWDVFQMNSRHLESLTKEKLSCIWILGGTMVEGKKMVLGAKVTAEREELTGSDKNPISPTN